MTKTRVSNNPREESLSYLFLGLLDHDTDADVHERHRELNDALSLRRNGQRRHSYVGLVSDELAHYAVPVTLVI